jgi:hypothetical protein
MPNLSFAITKAEAIPFAVAPTIAFDLKVTNANPSESIQSVALRCQILIEAAKRHYDPAQRDSLRDLFGETERWSQTMRSLLWCHSGTTVPAFNGSVIIELPVPCTFDFNVSAAKYFHALGDDGDVPLCFQFSGTAFYSAPDGTLQIAQIGWDKEARFRLPARVWREMMDHYYPNSAWLRLGRDTFDRLYEFKRREGFATWEEAVESLLQFEKEAVS